MVLSNFFGSSCRDFSSPVSEDRYTTVLLPTRNSDGTVTIATKILESVVDPLSVLKFSDYSINNMLAAGINPKAIHISKDIRIGSDKDIEKFNAHIDELAEQMFNSNN